MSKICIALFFLIFLMSGCHTFSFPTSDSFSDISSSDDLPQSEAEPSEIHFFGTLASGNGDGAETENGFFYIEPQTSSYANIQYIDFSNKTQFTLCSSLSCTHNNENCTSYLEWSGGYPYLAANSSKIILTSANAGAANEKMYHQKALPNIQIADLTGANRKTLVTLSANEDIQIGTACNEEYLYLIKKRVNGTSSIMDLCKVSLSNGALQTICRLPNGNSFILGAQNKYIIVVCYSPAPNGNLYSPSQVASYMCFDIGTEKCISQKEILINSLSSSNQNFVSGTTLYSFSPVNNTLSIYDLKNGQTVRSIPSFFEKEIEMGQIDIVLDKNILFSEMFVGDEDEITSIRFDLSTGRQTPFTLYGEYGINTGRLFPIVPSCSLKDEYLAVYKCDFLDAFLGDDSGMPIGILRPNFTFISKESYWSGIPEYNHLKQ